MNGDSGSDWKLPSSAELESITNALNATLDPRVSNQIRQEAFQHLEAVKIQSDGSCRGFVLARDFSQTDAVRYFGLQLMEIGIRYCWSSFSNEQKCRIQLWLQQLSVDIRKEEKPFIRNKIAQLWAMTAKRCWPDEWREMDLHLLTLWELPFTEKGLSSKLFVLYILEALNEDIKISEDVFAGLRLDTLGDSLNEIMIPPSLYAMLEETRGDRRQVRSSHHGWLAQICNFLDMCLKQLEIERDEHAVRDVSMCARKSLQVLGHTLNWVDLQAPVEVGCIGCLFLVFNTGDIGLQIAATEAFDALLHNLSKHPWEGPWLAMVEQILQLENIGIFSQVFETSSTGLAEDEDTHLVQKKLAEVLSLLAEEVAQISHQTNFSADPLGLFGLLIRVLEHKSLAVSISVLHRWTRLVPMASRGLRDILMEASPTLISICSGRLLRFESLSDSESDAETLQLLCNDFGSIAEQQAFLCNYRRYCTGVIRDVAGRRPIETMGHVLGQMKHLLQTGPYTNARGLKSADYSRDQLSVLKFDREYQTACAALKGFVDRLLGDTDGLSEQGQARRQVITENKRCLESMQQWSYAIMDIPIDDPEVSAQVLRILLNILCISKPDRDYFLKVILHVHVKRLQGSPRDAGFSNAVEAFEALRVTELQRLALLFPNYLLDMLPHLEQHRLELVQWNSNNMKLVCGHQAFMFTVLHRSVDKAADVNMRVAQLREMLEPVKEAWDGAAFSSTLSSLFAFCQRLDLADLPEFYIAYHFAQVADWAGQKLDEVGEAKQNAIRSSYDTLPLRATKSMLIACTEKLKSGTEQYDVGCALWGDLIPAILPKLLQVIGHAQAFYNMANWSQSSEELHQVIKRTLRDRFWQSGISNESKDEFYARVVGSKSSYEGFASTVRGTLRHIREQSYQILVLMSNFTEQFFGLSNLALPLTEALFTDVDALLCNHLHTVISLGTSLIRKCPPQHRTQFLPPLVIVMFEKLDGRINAEWASLGQARLAKQEEDELEDEMQTESVLRRLTHSLVSLIPHLLIPYLVEADQGRDDAMDNRGVQCEYPERSVAPGEVMLLSDFIVSDPSMLEPLLLFCTHTLEIPDTRCCLIICKVFKGVIPRFTSDTGAAPQVREFISSNVLKAGITSLNEPYFADIQGDLAMLIAQIMVTYVPLTATPREVLLSLPNMDPRKVDDCFARISKAGKDRQRRALVLDLLEGIRGVRISEAGKIISKAPNKKPAPVQQQYLEVEQSSTVDDWILEGVAGLFVSD